MATTISPAISNSISLASEYLPILDAIYKANSKSAILDTKQDRVRWSDEYHTFYLFETDMVGLGDYDRNGGYVRGDVTSGWRAYAPQYDRARQFLIDVLDNRETFDMAFGTLADEFIRTKVVPETDAVRFAQYAYNAGTKVTATLSTASDFLAAIDNATETLDDEEVPYEGRLLFVSAKGYKLLKNAITRMTMNKDANVNYNIEYFNDMQVIMVPKGRFNTAVTLAQPSAHDDAGGYTLSGNAINFMIIHPSAVMQSVQLAMPRIFTPAEVQQASAWQYDYRQYHGVWVKHQKTKGVYCHSGATVSG